MPIQFTTNNKTPYIAETITLQDESIVTIVKATFNFSTQGEVYTAEEQQQLVFGDEYVGEPGESSIKYASDIVPGKKGTDIALIGHAYASEKAAFYAETALRVENILKRVHVTGDRFWKWSSMGISRSRPLPFDKIPLVYERAFGGSDTLHKKSKKHGYCLENLVGTGYVAAKSKECIQGLALPNLENRKNEIKNWDDKPRPAGYGFIAPNWEPRIRYAGISTDDPGNQGQMTQLMESLDTRFYNAATPDLVSETPLTGTETVVLSNLNPETSRIKFNLPGINLFTSYIFQDRTERTQPVLDTLVIEPDENLFTMVWRSKVPDTDNLKNLKQVNIDLGSDK